MPYNGEFHFTALRTLGTFRTMSASSRFPTLRFQPGIAAMYARTGALPSAFAICGLPPARSFTGLALLLRRRAILGHRGLHQRLECARVDLLPFVDVDRPSRGAFQAGIEEARWVRDPGPLGERELHDLRVRLPGADNPVVRPDRSAHPLPLLGHLGVGFQDQRPHAGQGLPAPSPQIADPLVDEPGSGFPGRSLTAPHTRSVSSSERSATIRSRSSRW